MLRGKNKKKGYKYKVSGSRNSLSKRFWNKSKEVRMQTGHQMMRRGYFAMKNGSWEDFILKDTGRKQSCVSGPSKEYVKLARRWQRMKLDVWALCTSCG